MEWLEQAAQLCLVLGFCGGVFNYIVIRPLNDSIRALADSVSDLRADIKSNNARLSMLEGAVERIEKAVEMAHARIDKALLGGVDNHHDKFGH